MSFANFFGKCFSSNRYYIWCWKRQSSDICGSKLWSLALANILWLHSSLLWYFIVSHIYIYIYIWEYIYIFIFILYLYNIIYIFYIYIYIYSCDSVWKKLIAILLYAIGRHYVLSLAYMVLMWIISDGDYSVQIDAAEANELLVSWSSLIFHIPWKTHSMVAESRSPVSR